MSGWRLEHSYAALPAVFHSAAAPTPVRDPQFVVFNTRLAGELGLDVTALDTPHGAAIFGGNALPDGSGRWPRPTPATSSATSRRSATAAPSCSANNALRPTAWWTSS
jgi:hypothetical protein